MNSLERLTVIEQPGELLESFTSFNGDYEAEHRLVTTARGELSVLITPAAADDRHLETGDSQLSQGNPHNLSELIIIGNATRARLKQHLGTYSVLGFKHFKVKREQESKTVSVMPTASYLNSALGMVYAGSGTPPPFVFRAKAEPDEEGGKASGREFIESLTEGEVMIASPADSHTFKHDLLAHVSGYCLIDPVTFEVISRRSGQLMAQDKLATRPDGRLADKEAGAFAGSVDNLSSILNLDLLRLINSARTELREIVSKSGPKMFNAVRAEQAYRRLLGHRQWFTARTNELYTTNLAA